jgi:hypothetical protein
MKQKVCAVFDKPDSCEKCPCAYETEGCYTNFCQLAYYLNPDDVKTDKYVFDDIYTDEIPDWCPLMEVEVKVKE